MSHGDTYSMADIFLVLEWTRGTGLRKPYSNPTPHTALLPVVSSLHNKKMLCMIACIAANA